MYALIIEPNALISMLIEEELRELGFTSFDWACSQIHAIASAAKRFPDLITSEYVLDEGTGVGAVRAICAEKPVPTVFLVADHHAIRPIVSGAVVLEKPFQAIDFRTAVETARLIVDEKNLMFWQVSSRRLSSY